MSAPSMPSGIPNCLILPSASGKLSDCIQMQLPSTGTIILILIISWIILMAVAYIIYWFATKVSPSVQLNYWLILLILILAGIIVSLFV